MKRNTGTPSFSIEADPVGLGFRVAVQWPDGTTEYVTGLGSEAQAKQWIETDACSWMDRPDRLTSPNL